MIYLDNSATTNPKPLSVIKRADQAVRYNSFNSGRGGYNKSVETAGLIYDAREQLASFFNNESQNICFTLNCTYALNMAIKGSVKRGDHIIISNLEHNAVGRPVDTLAKRGIITYDTAAFSYDTEECVENFRRLIRPNTSVIVCMHASNVFGCVFPIKEIGQLARENNIRFIVDAAQSAGVLDIDMQRDNIDILCAPGHKGLYGVLGTGFLAVREGSILNTVIEGGTGSASMDLSQPDFLPDRFEPGTLNNSGIIALGAGVCFVKARGINRIYEHENSLICMLYKEMSKNNNITLYTKSPEEYRLAPILSFNYGDYPSEKTAELLSRRGIAVRAGYHCSPLAHRTFATDERGTVRISPSVFTSRRECEIFLNYLKKL